MNLKILKNSKLPRIRLKKETSKFKIKLNLIGLPWVYSNELQEVDVGIQPGSWVELEDSNGKPIAYGHFNPHSLIAFRVFENRKFESFEKTRALFFKRMDDAWITRQRSYCDLINKNLMGRYSYRLCFGEADGVPGLICDLYEQGLGGGVAVIQCHSAGADHFIPWLQEWLSQRMGIEAGVIRNDIEVRKKENAPIEKLTWGDFSPKAYVFEGGVRFFVELLAGQKTGYFYDLRDSRFEFAKRLTSFASKVEFESKQKFFLLDCFSYIGAWSLQVLRLNPNIHLVAIDVSKTALEGLEMNAKENRLDSQIEYVRADFFEEKNLLENLVKSFSIKGFHAAVVDPPSLTSSLKQKKEALYAHEYCYSKALSVLLKPEESEFNQSGVVALSSCSFHLKIDEFYSVIAKASHQNGGQLKINYFGTQSMDHPILSSQGLDSIYLKCAIGEWLR